MYNVFQFWAKLGRETWPDKYHPVICHLIDVAAVTLELWSKVFRGQFRGWVARQLALDEESCGRWLAFWSGAHDIGKVAACFQDRNDERTEKLKQQLVAERFAWDVWDQSPHGTISTAILAELLTAPAVWPALEPRLAAQIAIAIGGHHGVFPGHWDHIVQLLQCEHGPRLWNSAHRSMVGQLARLLGIDSTTPRPSSPNDQAVFMVLAGLTSVADWIGSNQTFFKPVGCPDVADHGRDLDEYFRHAQKQAQDALKVLGWLGREPAGPVRPFEEVFAGLLPGAPRPLQCEVERIARQVTGPSLLIIEAPMGEGKTEAAWYVADTWERRDGQGSYVALPTMATSNQMFERVDRFLQANAGKKNIMLLHGKAGLNEHFVDLKYRAQTYDKDKDPSAVVAEEWFAANKKQGLLAPYGVGTIDQALLAVLQTKHVFVRLFGLAGKCVILDEVHAYDAYMTTLMERLLRWLSALGCPVVLLSATLPRERRLRLLRAYAGADLPEPVHRPYPRLTRVAVGEAQAAVQHVEAAAGRQQTIRLAWLEDGQLAETLREALADGGCAAVIRNTVGLAQRTYDLLREGLKDEGIAISLFHARFPFGRRKQIENDVLARYGRTPEDVVRGGQIVSAPHRPAKSVLVATQIVEQSLDLDFDVLVSDVAPVDLVLQRAGRLHRHARGQRPMGVSKPTLWLITPDIEEGVPDFGPSKWVYARFVLLRSHIVLQATQSVRLPGDMEDLIEKVYGSVPLIIPGSWLGELEKAEKEMIKQQENQWLDAMDVTIAAPDESPLEQHNHQLEEENPEAAKKIQAQTRDSGPTVQLVVIYHLGNRDYLDPAGREPFDAADQPDVRLTRRILDNAVTINHMGCVMFYARRLCPKGWREKGMLRHHRIVRVDGQGHSLPKEGFRLRVDPELGISFGESNCVTGV